jgi:hypothetical protein
MVKRLLLTILLGICLVAMVGTEAPAWFGSYYGYTCCSTLTGEVEVSGGKNSVVTVDFVMTLQQACETDGQGNYSLGEPFLQTSQVVTVPIGEVTFLGEGGSQKVPIELDMDQFEDPEYCINTSGWEVVHGSVGILEGYFTHTHTRCVGKGDNPCDELAKKPFDVLILDCSLSEIQRNEDGTTQSGQALSCTEIP